MTRRMFGSPKPPRSKASVKLQLEKLEDRTLLSASPVQAEVSAVIQQYDQMLTVVQQDISNDIQAIYREISQAVSQVMQVLDARFGTPSSSPTSPATPPPPSNSAASGSITPFQPPEVNLPSTLLRPMISSGGGTTTTRGGGTVSTSGGGTTGTTTSASAVNAGTMTVSTGSSAGLGLGGSSSGGGVYVSGSGIPAGLADVSPLAPSYLNNSSVPYAETHTINRSESNNLTFTQSGSGTAGTFAVTVTGKSNAGDTTTGSGLYTSGGSVSTTSSGGSVSETSSGNVSASGSYKLVMTGTYSNGLFTITNETYSASGNSKSTAQTTTSTTNPSSGGTTNPTSGGMTNPSSGGTTTQQQVWTNSNNWSESWSASLSGGTTGGRTTPTTGGGTMPTGTMPQLVLNSFSYNETVAASDRTQVTQPDGGYSKSTGTAKATYSSSSTTGAYTGTATLDITSETYVPGSPPPTPQTNDQTNPVSGTIDLSSLLSQPSGWQWYAGASNATNYKFTGGASETASLSETATLQSGGSGPTLTVSPFNSSYTGTATSHVVDDEPQTPASTPGTANFHRDESYIASDTVTGSGSYGPGTANATYQSVQTGSSNVNDTLTDTSVNYTGPVSGSDSASLTNTYQDTGNGLVLTNPGSNPTPVSNPASLVGAFPFEDMISPNGAVYQPAPGNAAFLQAAPNVPKMPGDISGVQNWYNKQIQRLGELAKKKVVGTVAQEALRLQIAETGKGSGTFTLPSSGNSWAAGVGEAQALSTAQEKMLATLNAKGSILQNVTLGPVDMVITYAVDGIASTPRSGDAVMQYKYRQTFNGTNKMTGRPAMVRAILFNGIIKVHDDNFINQDLK